PATSPVSAIRRRTRNRAALLLFGRAIVTTLGVVSGALGFLTGIRMSANNYDPAAYATGVAALFAAACAVIAFLLMRRRVMIDKTRRLQAQGDLIVRRDANGLITYANSAFCALAGRSQDELTGKAFAFAVLEQSAVSVLTDGTRTHDQKIAGGESARWIAWREGAVRTGAGTEVQGVGRDVTDRVEAERALGLARDLAEAASRAKSRFLATVSHEIRTPLNGLLGMADLLLDTPLTPEQATYAKAAKASGETLLALIEEILDFSKIEAGRLELESRPFA